MSPGHPKMRRILPLAHLFGMNQEGAWGAPTNNYLYNGKGFNSDFGLNLNDYGARWYDSVLARWTSVDPLAEAVPNHSVFAYVFNSPFNYIDPTGMMGEIFATKVVNEKTKEEINIEDGHDFTWVVSDENFNRIKELGAIPSDLRKEWNGEFWRQVGQEMKKSRGNSWADWLLQFFYYDGVGDGIESIVDQDYSSALLAIFLQKLKKGKKGAQLVKKLFKYSKGNRLPTPDLDTEQFKKIGKNTWEHKKTGTIYSKSHTSHGNEENIGTQWKAWPKGTTDFGSTSKSTGTRVTIDGEGNVVGH
jgi:RHS repeat-associated protein